MKRLIFTMALALVACKKEEVKPTEVTPTENPACKCGVIQNQTFLPGNYQWKIEVANNCTGNKKYFYEQTSKEVGNVYCSTENW